MQNIFVIPTFKNKSTTIKRGISRANHLSYTSALSPKDQELLKKMVQKFRPFSHNYEDSWGYIIQSTRYDGFKWFDNKSGSLIFFGRKSPSSSILVVPSFFAELDYLTEVIKSIIINNNVDKVILKNVNNDDISKFKKFGFREYHQHEQWSKEARFDDQTYPQLVVDLPNISNPKGKSFHQLRRMLNKKPNVTLRKYQETDRDDVSIILALKDVNRAFAKDQEKGLYYPTHVMYLAANIDKFVITNKTTGEILGFIAASDISPTNTTLVASIFKPGVKVASVWGIYQTLLEKYHQGFKYINLGGLETEGSYTFLNRTFRPAKMLSKTHLVYELP